MSFWKLLSGMTFYKVIKKLLFSDSCTYVRNSSGILRW